MIQNFDYISADFNACRGVQTKRPPKYQINILWEAVEAAVAAAAAAVGHYCSEMWDSSLKSWRKQLFKLPPALHRVMVVWDVEFSKEGYKIREICQKSIDLDFQSQFSISKIIRIFLIFFSLKNTNLGAHFVVFNIF